MKTVKKNKLFRSILLLILLVLIIPLWSTPNWWKFSSPSQEKRCFTIRDALSLETFYMNWGSRLAVCGNAVAYAVVDGYHEKTNSRSAFYYVPEGSHIYAQSLSKEKEPVPITKDKTYSWSPAWSPDGKLLAFFSWHNNAHCLGIWDRGQNDTRFFPVDNLIGRGEIIWDPGGRKLYISISGKAWKGHMLAYEKDEDPVVRESLQKHNPYDEKFAELGRSQIVGINLNTKKVSPIMQAANIMTLQYSPDKKHVAVLEITENRVRVALVPTKTRLVVYSTDKTNFDTVIEETPPVPYAWSPDSRILAYLHEGKLRLYSPGHQKLPPMSIEDMSWDSLLFWHPDGERILLQSDDAYFLVDAIHPEKAALKLDFSLSGEPLFWSSDGKALFLKTLEKKTGKQGIASYSLEDKKTRMLINRDVMINAVTQNSEAILFTLQDADTPENIWVLNLITNKYSQLTHLNKNAAQFHFGRSDLLSWTSKSGKELQGVFLYPAEYKSGEKYPIVVEVYSTFSSSLHRFFTYLYNLQILTNQGYGVLLPDIIFNGEDLPRSYLDCVEPALDLLEERGIADGKFGIMGHSFGGYGTNVLATHSKRFQAGITLAGFCDWISYQAAPADFNRGYIMGCNMMGSAKPPHDYPDKMKRYIHNSPIYFVHQMETPLLIIHGMEDLTVPFEQAEEMFYTLRSIGKTAVLVGYPGERHLWTGTKIRVFEDMWARIIAWFDQYLK